MASQIDNLPAGSLSCEEIGDPYTACDRFACVKEDSHDHHNMDVIRIFKFCWKHIKDESLKEAIRVEIRKMLDWCLSDSLVKTAGKDGRTAYLFKDKGYEKYEETSTGIAFLNFAGYFNGREKPFWWPEDERYGGFKGSEKVLIGLIEGVSSIPHDSQSLTDALETLKNIERQR